MTTANAKAMTLRGISLFVAVVFTVTTLIGDPSAALASIGSLELLEQPKFQKELQNLLYSLPAEIGTVGETYFVERGTGNGERGTKRSPFPVSRHEQFVVLIQDAHANPEGQQNVAGMLKYLETKSPELVVGLEGAAGALHPEYLNFFKEFPEANQAVVADLKQKGELNGAELFLLEKEKSGFGTRDSGIEIARNQNESRGARRGSRVFGVESTELYRENLKTYRDLLFKRDEIQTFLNPIRAQLEKESSQKLNGELRAFLKERSRRKEGNFGTQTATQSDPNLQAYVRYLQKQSLKVLEIDLKDAIEQLRFPSLLRVVKIEEAQKGFDPEKVKSQWEEAVRMLRAAAKDKSEKEFVEAFAAFGREKGFILKTEGDAFSYPMERALYPRKLLEGLFRFAQKHKLSFTGQEAFWQSWKLAVFQAEINVTELLAEMNTLEEKLIQKLARSEEEKALARKLGNFDLLEKLLRLELSRAEYEKVLLGRNAVENLFRGPETRDRRPATKSKSPTSQVSGLKSYYAAALHFYDVSLQRDEALVENALALTRGERGTGNEERGTNTSGVGRSPSNVPRVSALITGGFHTPGIEAVLRQKGIGYAVFTPRITRTDHGEMYQRVMSDANADLSAYFNVKNPFRTKQEAILFKELLEIATPALSEKYRGTGAEIAGRVQKAVEENPVLSRAVLAENSAQDASALRFTPKPAGELLPANAAIPGIPVTSSLAYSEEVTTPTDSNMVAVPTVVTFTIARGLQIDTEPFLQEKGTDVVGGKVNAFGTISGGRSVPQASLAGSQAGRAEIRENEPLTFHQQGFKYFLMKGEQEVGSIDVGADFQRVAKDAADLLQANDASLVITSDRELLKITARRGDLSRTFHAEVQSVEKLNGVIQQAYQFQLDLSEEFQRSEARAQDAKEEKPGKPADQSAHALSLGETLRSYLDHLSASPLFHPFQAHSIRLIADALAAIQHPVVTIFDLDKTLWDEHNHPQVYSMPELLKALQTNGHIAGVISDKAIYIAPKNDAEQYRLAQMSETQHSEELVKLLKNSPQFEKDVNTPLKSLGIGVDDFDFFVMAIQYDLQLYRYFKVRNRKNAGQPAVEVLFPLNMMEPEKNIPQSTKLFAAKMVDLIMQRFFNRTELADAFTIMVGDNLKADHLVMAKQPILEGHNGFHQELLSFMANGDEVGRRAISQKGVAHVITPHTSTKGGQMSIYFNGVQDVGATFAVDNKTIQEEELRHDLSRSILEILRNIGKSEANMEVAHLVTAAQRPEVRSEMRVAGADQEIQEIGTSAAAGSAIGHAAFFSSNSSEEILFSPVQPDKISVEKIDELSKQYELFSKQLKEALKNKFQGEGNEGKVLEDFRKIDHDVKKRIKELREALKFEEKEGAHSPSLRQKPTPNPIADFFRRLRFAREEDLKGSPSWNDILDEARLLAITMIDPAMDPEAELAKVEANLRQIYRKQKKSFDALTEKTDFENVDAMNVYKIQSIMVDTLAGILAIYFGSEDAKKATLSRMKGDSKTGPMIFAGLLYIDALVTGVPKTFFETALYKKRREAGNEKMKNMWSDVISFVDDFIAECVEVSGGSADTHHIDAVGDEGNLVIFVNEHMGASKIGKIMKLLGHRITAFVTNKATLLTHWVALLQGIPVLLLEDSPANAAMLKRVQTGDEVAVLASERSKPGVLYIHPSEKHKKEVRQEQERAISIEASLRAQKNLPTKGIQVYANITPSQTENLGENGADGVGLTRSEADEETERRLIRVAEARAAFEKAEDGAAKEVALQAYQRELKEFQMFLESVYEDQYTSEALRGKPNTWRLLDLWPDKDEDFFDRIINELHMFRDSKSVSGFAFYRTDLGKDVLAAQLAALVAVRVRTTDEASGRNLSVSLMRVMFPHVRTAEEQKFLAEEVFPNALKMAETALEMEEAEDPAGKVKQAMTGISFGIMVETPETIENLAELLRFAHPHWPGIRFLSVGNNDLEMELIRILENIPDADRDDPKVQGLVTRLFGDAVKAYVRIAEITAEYNKQHAGTPGFKPIPIGFCGQVAGLDKFALFLRYLNARFNSPEASKENKADILPLSASMQPGGIPRFKFLLRQIPDDADFSLFEAPDADPGPDPKAEKMAARFFNARVENILALIADFNIWNRRSGSRGIFFKAEITAQEISNRQLWEFFSNSARELAGQTAQQEGVEEWIEPVLNRLFAAAEKKKFISPEETPEIRKAFQFLKKTRDIFEKLRSKDPQGLFAGGLNPDNAAHFIKAFGSADWKDPKSPEKWVPEFYHLYYKNVSIVAKAVRRLLIRSYNELVPPEVLESREYTPLERHGSKPVVFRFQKLRDVVSTAEGDLVFGDHGFLTVPDAEKVFASDPGVMIRVFDELAEYPGARISPETEQVLASSRGVLVQALRSPGARSEMRSFFIDLLKKDKNISDAILQMNSLRLMSVVLPGYEDILYRFSDATSPYPMHVQTMRAVELMEGLENQETFAFGLASETFKKLRKDPETVLTLRLAVLLQEIVEYRLKKDFQKGADEDQVRRTSLAATKEILAGLGIKEPRVTRSVAWLIASRIILEQKDLISGAELSDALTQTFASFKNLAGEAATEGILLDAEALCDACYLLNFIGRRTMVVREKEQLLKFEGLNSPLTYWDKFHLLGSAVLHGKISDDPETLKALIAKVEGFLKRGESTGFEGFERFAGSLAYEASLRGEIERSDFQEALGSYRKGKVLGIKVPDGQKEADLFAEGISNGTLSSYLKAFSPYRARGLNVAEVLQELFLVRHLELLGMNYGTVPWKMTPLDASESADGVPYRVLFGSVYDDPDLFSVFSTILFHNGFSIEKIAHFKLPNGNVAYEFIGFLKHAEPGQLPAQAAIARDLSSIFTPLNRAAGRLSQVLSVGADRRVTNRLDFMQKHYGNLPVVKPGGRDIKTQARFVGSIQGPSVLEVVAKDRRGLTAVVALELLWHFKLYAMELAFDDVHGDHPRLQLVLSPLNAPGKPVDPDVQQDVITRLNELLNYDRIEVSFDRIENKGEGITGSNRENGLPTVMKFWHPFLSMPRTLLTALSGYLGKIGHIVGVKTSGEKEQAASGETPAFVPVELTIIGHFRTEQEIHGQREYTIAEHSTVHAYPSSMLVKMSNPDMQSKILTKAVITKDGEEHSLSSVTSLMGRFQSGDKVKVILEGKDPAAIQRLFEAIEQLQDNNIAGTFPKERIFMPKPSPRSELRKGLGRVAISGPAGTVASAVLAGALALGGNVLFRSETRDIDPEAVRGLLKEIEQKWTAGKLPYQGNRSLKLGKMQPDIIAKAILLREISYHFFAKQKSGFLEKFLTEQNISKDPEVLQEIFASLGAQLQDDIQDSDFQRVLTGIENMEPGSVRRDGDKLSGRTVMLGVPVSLELDLSGLTAQQATSYRSITIKETAEGEGTFEHSLTLYGVGRLRVESVLGRILEKSGRSEVRESVNRQRMVRLLRHDLSGKIMALMDSADAEDVSKENLKDSVGEILVVFRIFDLEQFEARGGELFVPEGDNGIFAYRIPSQTRSGHVHQTPVFGARKKAQSFDKTALHQIAAEVGFDQIRALFSEEVKELERLREELLHSGEFKPEFRTRTKNLGEKIREKMGQLFEKWIVETTPVAAAPAKEIKRILLVDDDPSVRSILVRQLQSFGYIVHSAQDGVEAWETLAKEDFDLVITDLTMPKMGGFELARKIFARDEKALVIFISGYSSSGIDLTEFKGRKVGFLGKPFKKEELEKEISDITRSEMREEAAVAQAVATAPEVKWPLDMPAPEAAKANHILLLGNQENPSLSADVKLLWFYSFLTNRFPYAKVHIAMDHSNLLLDKRFRETVTVVRDAQKTNMPEPEKWNSDTVNVPPGALVAAVKNGDPTAIADWIVNGNYGLVFDFTKSGAAYVAPLQKLAAEEAAKSPEERKRLPVIFTNMGPAVTGNAEPVLMLDMNKPSGEQIRRVAQTDQVSLSKITSGKNVLAHAPLDDEKDLRRFRAMFGRVQDLQTIDLENLWLDVSEKEDVKAFLKKLLSAQLLKSSGSNDGQPQQAEGQAQQILDGKQKVAFVNVLCKRKRELQDTAMWLKVLSPVLEQTDAVLFFSRGVAQIQDDLVQLEALVERLRIAHPEAAKQGRIVLLPEQLNTWEVSKLIRGGMDAVITAEPTGIAALATAVDALQYQVALEGSTSVTYRNTKNNRSFVNYVKLSEIAAESVKPRTEELIEMLKQKTGQETKRKNALKTDGPMVLIADDEPSILNMSKMVLNYFCGVSGIVTAADGAEALGKFKQNPKGIDAIISDRKMPIMDGDTFVEAARKIREDIPVIIVSGFVTDGDVVKMEEKGYLVLRKPYTNDVYAETVKKATEKKGRPELRSAAVAAKSELRGTTQEVKETLMKVESRGGFDIVKNWVRSEVRIPVAMAAEVTESYSASGVASLMPEGVNGENLRKARLWIANQLLVAFKAQQDAKGEIDNPALRKIIESLDRYKVTGTKDPSLESREVHVALPLLSQAQLESLAEIPAVLAFAEALNAKLFLNVQGAAPKGLEQKFLDAAKRNGITVAPGNFRVFGVSGSEGNLFKSLNEPGVREDVLLAGEEKALPENKRATLWYNSPRAQEDMKVLAAEITEALYASLDQKVSRGSRRNISEHYKELTAAIANAIQASLKILVSA